MKRADVHSLAFTADAEALALDGDDLPPLSVQLLPFRALEPGDLHHVADGERSAAVELRWVEQVKLVSAHLAQEELFLGATTGTSRAVHFVPGQQQNHMIENDGCIWPSLTASVMHFD